ncbi:hypothetical protein ACLCDV_10540 [Sphingobacterium sp. Lzh-3]|uniref:hypothetical protein n=1 Tax=Sphingobacterium sp. Lzh-3 TaxID=3382150 RepID=UPI00398CCFF8
MKYLFLAITFSCIALFWFAVQRKLAVIVYIVWSLIISAAAFSGFFIQFPSSFGLTLLGTVFTVFYCTKLLADSMVNVYLLLAIHVVRIPVEFILFALFQAKILPREMTFIGWNFDLIFGITALIFLIRSSFNRKIFNSQLFILWNIFGICSLSIVITLGILSSPLPMQMMGYNQPNIAVLQFPYALLPNLIVPFIILSHILLLRNLITSRA